MEPQSFQPDTTSLLSKRNIIAFLIVGILLLSVPFAVGLVQKSQEFRSKATAGDPINFTGPDVKCQGDECSTTSDTIEIRLTAPIATPSPGAV